MAAVTTVTGLYFIHSSPTPIFVMVLSLLLYMEQDIAKDKARGRYVNMKIDRKKETK